ncbi:MAG TPA: peptidoglycan-binding domain-containing protein [Bryobacteraceae bacterium]|nr:peptidoglycan-binding domain-containing protein [Bryobacteraceae bacterium]
MRRAWLALLCVLLLGLGPVAAQQRRSRPAAAPSSGTRVEKNTPSKRTVSSRRPTKRATIRKRVRRKAVASWRLGQQQPTPERYREIQEALIARGYLEGPATGVWGPESVEALRRFQQDNHLDATGKINSLSLIALGLGPKRDSTALNGQAKAEAVQP